MADGAEKAAADINGDFGGLTSFTIEQVAAALERCIDDYTKFAKTSYEKIGKGSYSAGDLIQDMGDMWVRMLSEGVTVAQTAFRRSREGPGAPRRDEPETRPPRSSASEATGSGEAKSAIAEVIEDYDELAKELIRKWSKRASDFATKLESETYDANTAMADFADTVSLAIESGARLTWEALDALTILTGRLDQPYVVESNEFSTSLEGAALRLKDDLRSNFGHTLPKSVVLIEPPHLAAGGTKFKLRADATGRPTGAYRGQVVASAPDHHEEEVSVRIIVA